MKHITKIDVLQSINSKKLIFKEKGFDKFDTIFQYVYFSGAILLLLYISINERHSNSDLFFISIPFVVFLAFVIYRKVTEKNLIEIPNHFEMTKKREIVLDFGIKNSFEVYKNSKDCIILLESHGFTGKHHKSYVFLFDQNAFYFTTLKDNFRANIPSLISYITVKNSFKKYLSQYFAFL
jgi:hypothetical protein